MHDDADELWLIIARDVGSGKPVGIAPLVLLPRRTRGFSWRQIEFISNQAPFDHWDFIIKQGMEAEIVRLFMDTLQENSDKWDTLKFRNIMETSASLTHLRAYHDDWEEVNGHIAPYLPLPDDWDTLRASLSKSKRESLRRCLRDIEREFGDDWEFGVVNDDWDKITHYMSYLIDFHQARWEEEGQEGAFGDPAMKAFYDKLLERFFENGWLYLYYIRLGEHIAAVTVNFNYRGRAYGFVGGINSDLLNFAPGHLMTQNILQSNITMGLHEHDFMWGEQQYKFRWGARPRVDRTFIYRDSKHVKVAKHLVELARVGRGILKNNNKPAE
jgi:CelD/BcsL family acetyltransferase involved in cellulose biosynthesis